MDWMTGMQDALCYIEAHLTDTLDYAEIAKRAYVSNYYFQRAFHMLCGYTLGEYIRCRRLTLAGSELSAGNLKVIDAAIKYGYDSPDSFAKAFTRFHGVAPSLAKERGVKLKAFAPLQISLTLKGGMTMDYRIENMEAFWILGMERKFHMDTAFAEIPKFWDEYYAKGMQNTVCGQYGICMDESTDGSFSYLIADNCEPDAPVPTGYIKREIPAHTWAVFPCVGPMPESLQSVNRQIFSEWLPNNRAYEIAEGLNIERYIDMDASAPDYHSEIWLPVRPANTAKD